MARGYAGNTANFISVADASSLDIGGNFTVCAWIWITNTPGAGAWPQAVSKGADGETAAANHNFLLGIDNGTFGAGEAFIGGFENAAGTNSFARFATTLPTGAWKHLAVTYDGANVFLYVDGVQQASTASTNTPNTNNQRVIIGRNQDGSTNLHPWDGNIAEVGIWAVALNADEINALSKGSNPSRHRFDSLRLYLPLFGAAFSEPDLSGNENNGTENGTVGYATLHPPVGSAFSQNVQPSPSDPSSSPLSGSFSDAFTLGEEQLIIHLQGGADEQVQIFEEFASKWNDSSDTGERHTQDKDDTISLTDAVALQLDAAFESFDSFQDKWADEVRVSLEQSVAAADSFALADAVSVNLIVVGITQSLSDTIVLSDAIQLLIILQRELADRLVLSDKVQLVLTHFVQVTDLLSLSDAIIIAEDAIFSFDDQLNLTDAIAVILSQPLTVSVADTLALSDGVTVIRGGTDLSYLRRYLNDIST